MSEDPDRACPAPTIAEDAAEPSAITQAAGVEARAPAPATATATATAPAEGGASAEPQEARSRKKRLQLSCGECRRKKVTVTR